MNHRYGLGKIFLPAEALNKQGRLGRKKYSAQDTLMMIQREVENEIQRRGGDATVLQIRYILILFPFHTTYLYLPYPLNVKGRRPKLDANHH